MQANSATKSATLTPGFSISLDKKALKDQALSASAAYENLRHSLMHPLMRIQLKHFWRPKLIFAATQLGQADEGPHLEQAMNALLTGIEDYASLTEDKRPVLTVPLLHHMASLLGEKLCDNDALQAWLAWVNGEKCMGLAPEYRAMLCVYYLQMVHPIGKRQACMNMALLTYLLRCAGFNDVAEGVVYYFCVDQHRLTKIFIATQKSQQNKYFQTQWIMHYLAILQQFLSESKKIIQKKYDEALFDQARHSAHMNERQAAIIDQLMLNPAMRDKKALFNSSFYRALYIKQSRRTQERDFKALCDNQLVIMKDTIFFYLVIDNLEY